MALISDFSRKDFSIHSPNGDGYNVFPPQTRNGVLDSHLHENKSHGTPLFSFASYEIDNPAGNLFVSSHWHQEIEIICFFEGHATVHLSGREFPVQAGDIIFVNQNELHQISSDDTNLFYNAFVFRMDTLNFSGNDYVQSHYLSPLCDKQLFFPHILNHDHPASVPVFNEVREIIRMINKQGAGFQLMIKVSLLRMIGLLIGHHMLCSGSKAGIQNYSDREDQLKQILTYIHNNYPQKMYLENIASEFHMSGKYFSRYFKKHFGYTFVEFVNRLRIEKATHLLTDTDQQIMEICYNVGFENFSYFIRTFKNITGYTPAAYRNFANDSK